MVNNEKYSRHSVHKSLGARGERGGSLLEYAIGLAAIAMIAVVAVKATGVKVTRPICEVTTKGLMDKGDEWAWIPENGQHHPDCIYDDGNGDVSAWWR